MMGRTAALVAATLTALGGAATVAASPQPAPSPRAGDTAVSTTTGADRRDCGDVAFAPASDYGAFTIRADGLGCDLARDVAADVEGRLGESYRSHGFTCQGRPTGNALGGFDYTCDRGSDSISFTAS
ncbi:hypothetical protein DFQ14_102475 [Halopolyspora algeriensis]|uniref:Subtilisin inhibitor-like n=1 Tax=Halopolyspora algeriensis TaxID=1500506 RepID=A0A368VZA9_9ACTN|nr:hypothetical protein [Halopolyspora algeriensis]RCW46172.1 hypothetical protein DFQ14_102475 [Halopolyspora algeriensis]TQM55575.1 hypothetical protein FHU43_0350 [Halopolyspora algeriensis]